METINMFGKEAEIYPRRLRLTPSQMKAVATNIYPFEVLITLIGLEGYAFGSGNPVEIESVRIRVEVLGHSITWEKEVKLEQLKNFETGRQLENIIVAWFHGDLFNEAIKRVEKYVNPEKFKGLHP